MNSVFEKFKEFALTNTQMLQINGGETSCQEMITDDDVDFLMAANGWSEATAYRWLKKACENAATA